MTNSTQPQPSSDFWLNPGKRVETTYDFRKGTVISHDATKGYVIVRFDGDAEPIEISQFDLDIVSE